MRKHALTILLLFNSILIFAEKDLPAYGKIDKADLQLKECEFDKDAEAYNLISYGNVHYTVSGEDFNIVTERRSRIKILKEKGLDDVLLTGGGIIPEEDMRQLQKLGAGNLFPPGTPTADIAGYIREWVAAHRHSRQQPG